MATRDIGELTPTEFENLIFDLVRGQGMRNLVWRTPGADGGRDIEGQYIFRDFSGSVNIEKWYIEAKRYQVSVDWPTVWEKLAYANNADASFLLMVTSGTFSTKCVDEINIWNSKNKLPTIRFWPKSELYHQIQMLPAVGVKYGLISPADKLVPALMPLSRHLAKAIMASNEARLAGQGIERPMDLSAALSELLLARSQDIESRGRILLHKRLSSEPWYPWVSLSDPNILDTVDAFAFRALLCAIRVITGAKAIEVSPAPNGGGGVLLAPDGAKMPMDVGQDLIDTVLLWGDLDGVQGDRSISIMPRNGGGS